MGRNGAPEPVGTGWLEPLKVPFSGAPGGCCCCHSSRDRSPHIEPIQAPAADEPTRREHHGYFHDDGNRLTHVRGEQQDANSPEDKAD